MIDGNKLKKLRKQNNYSLNKLSRDINCHPRSISYWESEKRVPNKEHLIKLSELYHMPYEDLFAFIQSSSSNDNQENKLLETNAFEQAEENAEANFSPIIKKEDILYSKDASAEEVLQICTKEEPPLKDLTELQFLDQERDINSYLKMALITYGVSFAVLEVAIWSIIGIVSFLACIRGMRNRVFSFNDLEFILYSILIPLIFTGISLLLKRKRRKKSITYNACRQAA